MPTKHDDQFVEWLPRPSHVLLRSRTLAAVTALAAAALTLLAAFAHQPLLVVDWPLAQALRSDELVEVLRWISQGGSPTAVALLSLVVAAALWPLCRAFAMALPLTVWGGIGVDLLLKVAVHRPRPPDILVGTALGSFPSGHVIQATIAFGLLVPALYLVSGRAVVFWLATALFVVMTGGVGISRIALGAHWPSDVLASFLIGALLLLSAEYFVGSRWARDRCGACRLHRPSGGVEALSVGREQRRSGSAPGTAGPTAERADTTRR